MVVTSDTFTVAATKDDGFSSYDFEVASNSPFVICYATGVLTSNNSDEFIGNCNSSFLMNLVFPDDVNGGTGCYQGNSVDLISC